MNKLNNTIIVVLILITMVVVNMLANQFYTKVDITTDSSYTLSDGTKEIIDDLEEPITIKLFSSIISSENKDNLKQFEIPIKIIKEFIKEYDDYSDTISLEIIDVELNSDEEDTADNYGLHAVQASNRPDDKFYFGLVAINMDEPDKEAVLPFMQPHMEIFKELEYSITKLLIEITKKKKRKIGVISDLPIVGNSLPPQIAMKMGKQSQRPWLIIESLKFQYDFVTISKEVHSIAKDIDGLLIVHPKNLPESILFAIDQYLLNGGKLMIFIDELSIADNPPQQQQMARNHSRSSSLSKFTKSWGLTRSMGNILLDNKNCMSSQSGPVPWVIRTNKSSYKEDSKILKGLSSLSFYFAASYTHKEVEGIETELLLKTSNRYGNLGSMGFLRERDQNKWFESSRKAMKDVKDKKPAGLVYQFTGKFKTIFPEGIKKNPKDKSNSKNANRLKESVGNPSVILIPDVDILSDQLLQQRDPFGRPMNSNIQFIQNMVEYTMGNESLLSIRAKTSTMRPLSKLDDIRQSAEDKRQKEIDDFIKQRTDLQKSIDKLTKSQDGNNVLINLTPEVKDEIDALRTKSTGMNKKIRSLKFQSAKEVDSKKSRIKYWNFFLIPSLLVALGLSIMFIQKGKALKNG